MAGGRTGGGGQGAAGASVPPEHRRGAVAIRRRGRPDRPVAVAAASPAHAGGPQSGPVRRLHLRLPGAGRPAGRPAGHDLQPVVGHGRRRQLRRAVLKAGRSEEHTSELQSLMRISYAVFCLKKKKKNTTTTTPKDVRL